MNDTTQKWIEAAKLLGRDPAVSVECPVCGSAKLAVEDIPNPGNEMEFERYLRCPSCDAVNVMKMRKKSDE